MKMVYALLFSLISQITFASDQCISFGMRPGQDDPAKACFEIEKDPSGILQVRRVRLYTIKGLIEVVELDSVFRTASWRGHLALAYNEITGHGHLHKIRASQSYNSAKVYGVTLSNLMDNYTQRDENGTSTPPVRNCIPGGRCI
jgi:hypothetical protein